MADRRQRQWAPGWPTAELSTEMRTRVLASVLPGSTVSTEHVAAPIDEAWKVEPVAEAEPHRTRTKRFGKTRLTTADPIARRRHHHHHGDRSSAGVTVTPRR